MSEEDETDDPWLELASYLPFADAEDEEQEDEE